MTSNVVVSISVSSSPTKNSLSWDHMLDKRRLLAARWGCRSFWGFNLYIDVFAATKVQTAIHYDEAHN